MWKWWFFIVALFEAAGFTLWFYGAGVGRTMEKTGAYLMWAGGAVLFWPLCRIFLLLLIRKNIERQEKQALQLMEKEQKQEAERAAKHAKIEEEDSFLKKIKERKEPNGTHCFFCGKQLSGRQRKWCSTDCQERAKPISEALELEEDHAFIKVLEENAQPDGEHCFFCGSSLSSGQERWCSDTCEYRGAGIESAFRVHYDLKSSKPRQSFAPADSPLDPQAEAFIAALQAGRVSDGVSCFYCNSPLSKGRRKWCCAKCGEKARVAEKSMSPPTDGQIDYLISLGVSEDKIPETRREASILISQKAGPQDGSWRDMPTTERQTDFLIELGADPDEIPETRGRASELIDVYLLLKKP